MQSPPLGLEAELLGFASEDHRRESLGNDDHRDQADAGREDHDEILYVWSASIRFAISIDERHTVRTSVHLQPRYETVTAEPMTGDTVGPATMARPIKINK